MRYIFSLIVCLVAVANVSAAPPNIVLILVDDVGYADIGCQGAKGFKTPNIDRLAAQGMRFTDYYTHPVCGVTRAALLTGCYSMRVGEVGNNKHQHPILHPKEITLAELMKEQGYATGMIGKWHLAGGSNFPAHLLPNAQGFDYWFGTPSHNGTTRTIKGSKFRTQLMRDGKLLDDSLDQAEMDQLTRRYTEEATAFIKKNKQKPFFLYLAHNMAHVVLGATDKYRGSSKRSLYGDVMQELDWSVEQVMKTLKDEGLDNNTLVVFISDNGPWVEKVLAGKKPIDDHYGRCDPLRGFKMTTWEGGVRVPCIARFPGKIPAGKVCKEPIAVFDWYPTFARLVGVKKLPAEPKRDGHDLWPLLEGKKLEKNLHEAIYFYSFTHLQGVRSGKWKLVLPRPAKPAWTGWSARMIDAVKEPMLFDLEADISEKTNVAKDHPEVMRRLMTLIEKGRADLGDYNRIGAGQRFHEDGPKRTESKRWLR